jgi:hypothetical protein
MKDPSISETLGLSISELLVVLPLLLIPTTFFLILFASLPKNERRIVLRAALFGGLSAITIGSVFVRTCSSDVRLGDVLLLLIAVACGMKACQELGDVSNNSPAGFETVEIARCKND